MKSAKRLTLTSVSLLLLASFAASCASGPSTLTVSVADCGSRIPPQLRDAVPPPPLPDDSAASLAVFGYAAIQQLATANDEKATGFWIVDQCEREKAKAVEQANRRSVWQKLTPWRE